MAEMNPSVAIDWQSIQTQQSCFDKFKILADDTGREGLDLNQFKKFLLSSLYPYLNGVTRSKKHQTSQVRFDEHQEAQLFKHFDLNKDSLLDQAEFAQNDFIDGSLALIRSAAGQDGAEVVPVINKLLGANLFDTIVYTQDWHPIDHIGFHDNLHLRKYTRHRSTISRSDKVEEAPEQNDCNHNVNSPTKFSNLEVKVFDKVYFDDGKMEQILWPRHCVQGSWGAELHPKLKVIQNSVRIHKGTLSEVDAYSAFWDNMRLNETNLRAELTSRAVTDVFFCGLAYDYCVAASALDSRRANFMTYVIEDACRGISTDSIKKMTDDMVNNDILIVNTESTCNYLASTRAQFHHESSRMGDEEHNVDSNQCHQVEQGFASEDDGNHKLRSDDIMSMLVEACYKKAFL